MDDVRGTIHDIREAATPIVGLVPLVSERLTTELEVDLRTILVVIERNAQRLVGLCNDLDEQLDGLGS